MKFKQLIKLGILAGTVVCASVIAIEVPKKMVAEGNYGLATSGVFEKITDTLGITEFFETEAEEPPVDPRSDAHYRHETGEIRVPESAVQVTVKKVIDGDTYLVDLGGKETKVRLIGVDTPESVASDEYLEKSGKSNTDFGKQVSDAMKEKIPEGSTLFLCMDVQEIDKYGRCLAYAYFEDGEMVQDYLLKNGYARVMTVPPNIQFTEHFLELQKQAMDTEVGIWQDYDAAFGEQAEAEQEEPDFGD